MADYEVKRSNNVNLSLILNHTPAGTSTKTPLHFVQKIETKESYSNSTTLRKQSSSLQSDPENAGSDLFVE